MEKWTDAAVMERLSYVSDEVISAQLIRRTGETRIGQVCLVPQNENEFYEILQNEQVKYIVLGIPEDIGIRANFGRPGAESAWRYFLPALLNMQSNQLFSGRNIAIAGALNLNDLMSAASALSPHSEADLQKLRELTAEIDSIVAELVELIASHGKILIAIGGGHNNAYPIIKGFSSALSKPMAVMNFDMHADLRAMEGRHSGNGFSYAVEEQLIKYYHIFGLQTEFNNDHIFQTIKSNEAITYTSYDDLLSVKRSEWLNMMDRALENFSIEPCGLEVDLDAVTGYPASAYNPCGFSPEMMRSLIKKAASLLQIKYLHLSEAAPELAATPIEKMAAGKFLAQIVLDVIKSIEIKQS
ncbi:formimidoylglutamase [Thermaurantimonas aggregans]|uniref:formimidoylglutamase n=1 Tax=Thermaurantimonas aggregans TaxID=2173829 RepID=UPI0023F116AA|nr:formimidoylglutamase [Thermaurantimonas aggregans]MCX8148852.1 formimidoylglutamase [Thermaurantimonas aggregans]